MVIGIATSVYVNDYEGWFLNVYIFLLKKDKNVSIMLSIWTKID